MPQKLKFVLVSKAHPLDVLRFRVPHCSMLAPEASQARITPAYHEDQGEAREYLRGARQEAGYVDCSTCPERLIFDYLWLDATPFLADSKESTNPFVDRWTQAESRDRKMEAIDPCGHLERCPSGTEEGRGFRIYSPGNGQT